PAAKYRRRPSSAATLFDEICADGLALFQDNRRLTCRDQTARSPDHDQDHSEAEQQHAVLSWVEGGPEEHCEKVEFAHTFRAANDGNGSHSHADRTAHAAESDDGKNGCGL